MEESVEIINKFIKVIIIFEIQKVDRTLHVINLLFFQRNRNVAKVTTYSKRRFVCDRRRTG